jgi:3-hydroxyacyl-[acyl-carrier-protein] dehydratase
MSQSFDTKLTLSQSEILEIQKNRPPMLMVDRADELLPLKKVIGIRAYHPDEWFFKCHWPGDPNVPGVLHLESMFQTASLAILFLKEFRGKAMYLNKIENAYFKRKILPNSNTVIDADIISFRHGIAKCSAKILDHDGEIFSHAKFTLAIPMKVR